MLTVSWMDALLVLVTVLLAGWCFGMATASWRRRQPRDVATWHRLLREWEDDQWGAGSSVDGQFANVIWLPTDRSSGHG